MTIEDGLEELEEKKKKAEKQEENICTAPTDIVLEGHRILSKYLTDTVCNYMALSKPVKDFIHTYGPYALEILPEKGYNSGPIQKAYLVDEIKKEHWLACLKSTGNEHLLQTDLAVEDETLYIEDIGKNLIPGLQHIQEKTPINVRTFLTHPYTLVMTMSPEYRPFMAIAIQNGIQNKKLKIPQGMQQAKEKKEHIFENIPSIEMIGDTAKKLKITGLQEIIFDLNEAIEIYKNAWEDA